MSADKKLSLFQKLFWFLINIINNNSYPKKSFNIGNFVKVKKMNVISSQINWDLLITDPKKSPSRLLSDLFWSNLPWDLISGELGNLNIFDTGCGSGQYALFLNQFTDKIKTYTGVDFNRRNNWDLLMEENPFIKLIENSSSTISKLIENNGETNFFITQSAIEHFKYDLKYFQEIDLYIKKNRNNVIQVHLFPSPVCLWLYLFHGVRQYNFRSILKIIDIFKSTNSYYRIYPLGGNHSNIFHFKNLTIPKILKKINFNIKDNNSYIPKLKNVILRDCERKISNNPCYYALIIHSNYSKEIF